MLFSTFSVFIAFITIIIHLLCIYHILFMFLLNLYQQTTRSFTNSHFTYTVGWWNRFINNGTGKHAPLSRGWRKSR